MIYLQKSAKTHSRKYNIFGAEEGFVSMSIILYALSIDKKVSKLEHPTPIYIKYMLLCEIINKLFVVILILLH